MNGIVLLAAGRSLRFESDKRLHQMADGRTLLQTTLDSIEQSEVACLTVLRHDDYELAEQLSAQYERLHFMRCPESALGMGYSLAFGVEQAAFKRFTSAAIALADMPLIEPATYRRVCHHLAADKILIPRHQNKIGHPIGFGGDFFDELKSIRGDYGARGVWQQHPDRVEYLDIDDAGILIDIDTTEELPEPTGSNP